MKVRFARPDPEYDRQCLKNYYFNEFLSDDVDRDEDEEAARGTMFGRLAELARVVKNVKKKRT